ncbi:exodeoxyribonuclease VII large subunit [Trueperella sp. LYQ143]|uniref:exodeoxyribonuclease VII large subunit n=1 Tax=unclassified Trueperella TaxID=2630174 RepID=UPI00398348DA
MTTPVTIPPHLPQRTDLTTPEHPWPLGLLAVKMKEYIAHISRLWVEGEITQFTMRPGAKVQFFRLQDPSDNRSMQVKIWTTAIPAGLHEGMRVVLGVKPDFWDGKGEFTLQAFDIRPVGTGDLLARIEALRAQLAAEGLFHASRKRPLPFLPRTIGLICGRNTKAKEDVVENVVRRWPAARFDIREVVVQGPTAVDQMLGALDTLAQQAEVDVIIFARGGGSVEDLFPFSDERLLRAVSAVPIPVVSAIGHEGDCPLLDLVADFRASTPTDAAKNVVPNMSEEKEQLAAALQRGRSAITNRLATAAHDVQLLRSHPAFSQPTRLVDMRGEDLRYQRQWLTELINRFTAEQRTSLASDIAHLRALSPLATLQRGYAVLRTPHGVLSRVRDANVGMVAHATLADGSFDITIDRITPADRKERL